MKAPAKSSKRKTVSKNSPRYSRETEIERSMMYLQRDWPKEPVSLEISGVIDFRAYQKPVFDDRTSGVLVLHWSRQIGKSFTLAAWAVDRLITRPGRLVTVLSNSRENGAEFLHKCAEICEKNHTQYRTTDDTPALGFEDMRLELRIVAKGKLGRIKVLASNPRTARGFSGDLILDEFAFHEDADAIWEAAEPILSSNKDYLCRIASTGNGSHNLFYRLAQPANKILPNAPQPERGGVHIYASKAGYTLSRVTRTQAHWLGMHIYDTHTREIILPDVARERALDKRAYDQNYECAFDHSSYALLTHSLIDAAERPDIGIICEQDWSIAINDSNVINGSRITAMEWLQQCSGPLFVGFDIARNVDLSVITVMEKLADQLYVRAILRMLNVRMPDQQDRLREICRLRTFRRAAIDMTGLGFGMVEQMQRDFGGRIQGVNFASTVPLTSAMSDEGRKRETVRVPEALAMELLLAYERGRIRQPIDRQLRDDLCKPERIMTPGGRVSIAATRDAAGHADHFWSFALAVEAAATGAGNFVHQPIKMIKGRREGV